MKGAAAWSWLWLLAACGDAPPLRGDDLADGVLVLPRQLREVSGIAALDERTVAGVQDEAGAVFFVDLLGERPPRVAVFGERGDYEGLCRVGDDHWVLRSDGFLVRLQWREDQLRVSASWHLATGHQDFEGLCHDAERGQLLILPKDKTGSGKQERDRRRVLGFDLATGVLLPTPVVEFRAKAIAEQAAALGLVRPTSTGGKGKERAELELLFSEILALPGSGDLLMLSAVDHLLLRIDRGGRLLAGARLAPEELPQPEAMTLLSDGRLLVASEAVAGVGAGAAVLRVVPVPGHSR